MAKYGKSLAQVVIEINGKKQAEQVLKAMQSAAKTLEQDIRAARSELEQLALSGGGPDYDAKNKQILEMDRELKQLNKAINESKKFTVDVGSVLDNMSKNNVTVLNRTKRALEGLLNSITPNTQKAQKQIEKLQKAIKQVSDEIDRRKGKIVEFEDIMKNLGKATPKQLDAVGKRLQTQLDSVTKNSNAWRKLNKQMRLLQEERGRRATVKAQDIMGGNYVKTIEGTKQAIEFLKKYQTSLDSMDTTSIDAVSEAIKRMSAELETASRVHAEKVMKNPVGFSPEEISEAIKYTEKLQAATPDSKEWTEYAKQIAEAKKVLDSFSSSAKMEIMADQFVRLTQLSDNALSEQKKYWEDVFKSAEKGTSEYILAEAKLKQIVDLQDARMKSQSRETLTAGLNNAGTSDIRQSVEWLTKYQSTLEPLSREWREINDLIEAGNNRLKQLSDDVKMEAMADQFARLTQLSENALSEQKKYWEDVFKNAEKGTAEYDLAEAKLKHIVDLQNARMKSQSRETLTAGLNNAGTADIRQSVEWLTKYQSTLEPLSREWREINDLIEAGNNRLKQLSDDVRMEAMADQFSRLTQLSEKALTEQKKYWEDVFKNAEKGTAEYDLAEAKLKQIVDLQNARMKSQSRETLTANLNNAGTADIRQSVEWLAKYQSTIEPLSREWRDINDLIEAGNNRLKQLSDSVKKEAMADQFSRLTQLSENALNEQKKYWEDVFKNTENGTAEYGLAEAKLKQIVDLQNARMKSQSRETLTANLSNAGTADIRQSVEWLTKYQSSLEPLSREWREINDLIEAGNNRLKQLSDNVRMEAMTDQFSRLTQLSEAALANQKKYWEDVFKNAEKGTANYSIAEGKLNQIMSLEKNRIRTDATATISNALSGSFNKTNEETREAIKLIEEYKKQLSTGNVDSIKEADKAISELNRKLDQAKLSSFRDVIGNMDSHSTEQIKQAVDWLTKYRSTLSSSTQEWTDLGVEIQRANEYMAKAEGADKLAVMEQRLNNIGTVSTSALAELKKYWQEVVDGTDKGNTNLAQYEDNLRRVIEEEKTRKAVSAEAVMANLDGSSVEQIREAIKATEELRESVQRSDPQWAQYNAQVENAKNYLEKFEIEARKAAALDVAANLDIASTGEMKQSIDFLTKYRDTLSTVDPEYDSITQSIDATTEALKKFNDSVKMDAMNRQMQNLNNLSKAALAEQKKYWQGVYDSAEKASQAYRDAESNLMKLDLLERSRTSSDATKDIADALSGNWNRTVKETEEAIKLIQEYKNQLRTQSDSTLIDQANEAIESLNRNLGKAKEALMDVKDAKKIASSVNVGTFNGTSEDIDKARKSLEAFRKTLKLGDDAEEINKVEDALAALSASAAQGGKNLKNLDDILMDLSHASMDDLQSAAKRLQEELKKATRNTTEYARTSVKLQQVNKELEKIKKEWEGQESLFIRMTKRLSVYMAAYGSLSAITSYVKDLGKANLDLSDSIADVAKTTGLEAKELAKLGEDIRAIDTRTAQEQLYELAAAAGQLGIKSETEVAGFVRAANMITVSLNELGTEATTQLMKIATLTGESEKGTEQALLSIGSAINELTASSAAAAGPIVDLMNRMGGIAAQSGITSAQMAAIGATADALGQSVEITGTSMNKFLATLLSNTDQVAYALNMDARALRSFINEGKTMDAVVAVFEKMNDMGGLGKLAPVMGDLGSEGARMTQVLAAMAEKVDFLKGQLEISTEAYNDAISIQNEYNVKNENAIAILQRMGNALKEFFVNNAVVDVFTDALRAAYEFFILLGEGSSKAYALVISISALTASLVANRIAWIKNMQAMSWERQLVVLRRSWRALTTTIIAGTTAVKNFVLGVPAFITGLTHAHTRTVLLANAWKGLGKVLAKNWITVAVAAFAGLVAWMVKAATYVSETAKATAKYNRELQEEKDKVDTLFNSLTRLNNTEADRAEIINQINQQYGQYLGFMLNETDSANKLAAAHQLINAELQKRMALNLKSTLQGSAASTYAEEQEKITADIGKMVESLKLKVGGGEQPERSIQTTEVMNVLNRVLTKTVSEAVKTTTSVVDGQVKYTQSVEAIDEEAFMQAVRKELSDKFKRVGENKKGEKYVFDSGERLFINIESYIKKALKERVKYQKNIIMAENQANIELEAFADEVFEARDKMNQLMDDKFQKMERQTADYKAEYEFAVAEAKKFKSTDKSEAAEDARDYMDIAEKQLRDHYERMIAEADNYVSSSQKLMKEHNEKLSEDEKKEMNDRIEFYKKESVRIPKEMPGIDPWDKGRDVKDWREFSDIVTNLDTSSAKALAAAFKKIKDEAALFPDDVQKVYELFQRQGVDEISLEKLGLKDADSVADMVWNWEKQIKDKLEKKYHRNTELGFIFKEDGGGRRQKDEYQAALAALEAYYNDRQEMIRKRALLENKTEEDLNKDLRILETEHLSARVELRKLMLSKNNEFLTTFSHVATSEFMIGIDYKKLAEQLPKLGKAMTQGLEKNLTADLVQLQKLAWEHNKEISRILLENDPVKKVALEYQQSFEKIELFWAEDEKVTEDAARHKMATLLEFSAKRAKLSDKGMRAQLSESQEFGRVVKTMNAEEFQAFLVLLDQYAEAATSAKRQATQKAIQTLEFNFDNSDTGKQVAGQLKNIEEMEGRIGELNSSGLMMEANTLSKQKELVEQRIALEMTKWEMMIAAEKNGMNRSEVLQELTLNRDKAQYQARLEIMKLVMNMDKNMFGESGSRIDQMQGWGTISEIDATERQRSLINAELALQQWRIDELIRIEEEGQGRQDVIDNLRQSKQDAYYKAERRLTELTMQEYQQRAQIANEWGSAIGTGLGEMIMGTEDAGKALVKNLATMAVQSLGQMAQMYVARQLLLQSQNASEASAALTTASIKVGEAVAVGAAETAKAQAQALASPESVATWGAAGAAKGAVISGLIAAAVATAVAIINSLFPGSSKKADNNRKLSTGMLTYAEGNYPVLGNDGKVYDAKYEGSGMKTGIYGGGAHFGIFSEKQPEMIVDGKTTQKLILNYPYIYDAITTIAKNGRLVNAMPTFASGDYPAGMQRITQVESKDMSYGFEQMEAMQQQLAESREINRRLLMAIENGIVAHLDGLEAYNQQKKNQRFLQRRGID